MSKLKPRRKRNETEAGLTLVEMMVSILLAAVLSAGLFYMTAGQQRTYTSQIDTLQLQENLWGAMEYLKRQVRQAGAGFGGCIRGKVYDGDPATPSNAVIHAMRIFNGCELAGSGVIDNDQAVDACSSSSFSLNNSDSFSVTIRPTKAATPFTGTTGMLMTQVTRRSAGTDVRLPLVSHQGWMNGSTGHHLIVYPFGDTNRNCVLRRVTGVAQATTTDPAWIDTQSPNGRSDPTNGFLAGTVVLSLGVPAAAPPASPLVPRYFAIDRRAGYPRLVTWTSNRLTNPSADLTGSNYDIIAEGVEDMQISYACDANDDQRLDEGLDAATRLSDEWFFNVAGTETLPDCKHRTPGAVRITLIGRARSADPRFKTGFRPAAEDHAAGTPAADRALSRTNGTFARRVLTVVVRPENMRQPVILAGP